MLRTSARGWRRSLSVAAVGLALSSSALPAPAVDGVGEPFDAARCGSYAPGDPKQFADSDWAQRRMRTDEVHQLATGRGIRIAVIDTGVDTDQNPVLTRDGRTLIPETYNFAGYDRSKGNDKQVNCKHGTNVASVIVGHSDAAGFSGLAPDARVISIRALQAATTGAEPGTKDEPEPLAPTIRGIRKAIELKVDVINISQQGTDSPEYRAAVQDAISAGIVVVAAAGNRGGEAAPPYPAGYRDVIAVGMTDVNDQPSPTSQFNPELKVAVGAPGWDVLVANPSGPQGQSWVTEKGTSFAAPLVSATAALLLQREPRLTPLQVKKRLEETADPPAAAIPDKQLGHGIVNPYRALTSVPASTPGPPVPPGRAPDATMPQSSTAAGKIALAVGAVSVVGLGVAAALFAAFPGLRRRRG